MFSPGNLRATFDNPAYEKLISHYISEKYTLRCVGLGCVDGRGGGVVGGRRGSPAAASARCMPCNVSAMIFDALWWAWDMGCGMAGGKFLEGEGRCCAALDLNPTLPGLHPPHLTPPTATNPHPRTRTCRYTGGMVPDVFQIIVKEKGVFTNVISPTTKAKLRLLFEVRACQWVWVGGGRGGGGWGGGNPPWGPLQLSTLGPCMHAYTLPCCHPPHPSPFHPTPRRSPPWPSSWRRPAAPPRATGSA
jgi:hypothetical protein